jgi:hypothetical protein
MHPINAEDPEDAQLPEAPSNGVLYPEASFREHHADEQPITPPVLGKAEEPAEVHAVQSRSWFGFFLGYSSTSAADAESAAAQVTASDAAADIRSYSSRGAELPVPPADALTASIVRFCCFDFMDV